MRVFLTGGTGFIGRHLVSALTADGGECVVVSRSGRNPWNHGNGVRVVQADPTTPGSWQEEAGQADVVVNLAGEAIVDPPTRWTETVKNRLRQSRVATTRNVTAAIKQASTHPRVLVSSSAVGYYGSAGDRELGESAPPGDDFLARLSVEWEQAALEAKDVTRVVIIRTGMVLGMGGGVLARLLPLFKVGAGGPWGDGKQWWPWIHMDDHIGLIRFTIDRDVDGPFNLTAPNPVTVNEFATALGKALGRPSFARAPGFILRLAMGEAADTLLASLRVVPSRALEAGYQFKFPELAGALESLFGDQERGSGKSA